MKIVADESIAYVGECFSSIGQVETVRGTAITRKLVHDADVLLVRTVTRVNSDLLAGSNVRFVGAVTSGFDHIDVDFLQYHNIGFASAPGSNGNSVAEYVIAALLEIGQKYNLNLQGKSIGIIGVGNIGSRVEKKAVALGMKIYLNDPPLQRQTGDAKYLPIGELYDCDFVTLHTPLTFEGIDKTFHLADERFFKSLRGGCFFFNTARGGVVDSKALKAAIAAGKLKATVLDVWENEPNIDTELLEMVDIGTAHIAGYSLDGKVAGTIMVYKAVCEYFGLEVKFGVGSFLPEPTVRQLKINPQSASEEKLLCEAVKKIYDIEQDDTTLRQIFDERTARQGEFFEGLRRNYPVHREFGGTQIVLESSCDSLAGKLAGIGFKEVKIKK